MVTCSEPSYYLQQPLETSEVHKQGFKKAFGKIVEEKRLLFSLQRHEVQLSVSVEQVARVSENICGKHHPHLLQLTYPAITYRH